MTKLRTQPQWPGVGRDAGHYESFYLKLAHPSERLAVWIRQTVHKEPGQAPHGSVWFTLFDGSADRPQASKVTLGPEELGTGADHYIRVGRSRVGPGSATGEAASEQLDARWELEWDSTEPPFRHLPRDWMYTASLPRTKLLSPYPAATYRGWVQAGSRRLEIDGWPGMVGHNWGAQHAERWIWLHGTRFAGHEDAWFDAALGRIKLGPLTTPWIGNAVLVLDGERHRLGGLERTRSTKVNESPTGARFALKGKDVSVRGEASAPRKDFVGWVYADPDGSEHNTVNCSISEMTLTVSRGGAPDLELRAPTGAAYELGMRDTDHGMPLQPFPDG